MSFLRPHRSRSQGRSSPRPGAGPEGGSLRATARPARRWVGPGLVCLLMLLLPAACRADAVSDALRCLEEQSAAETNWDRWITQADSIGRVGQAIAASGRPVPQELLRQGEKIQARALEQELELVAQRLRCRDLAQKGLDAVGGQIRAAEADLRAGGGSEAAAKLLRLTQARTALENVLIGPVTLRYPVLLPDSTDTQEVLRAKLQYYADIGGYLRNLDDRVRARLDLVVAERRTLAEAQRFVRDLDFLNEGGRTLPGSSPRDRALLGNPEGLSRAGVDSSAPALAARDVEFILGLTPSTAQQSDQVIALLRRFRKEIEKELASVEAATMTIKKRILPVDERP